VLDLIKAESLFLKLSGKLGQAAPQPLRTVKPKQQQSQAVVSSSNICKTDKIQKKILPILILAE